jgi:hypothetical protein
VPVCHFCHERARASARAKAKGIEIALAAGAGTADTCSCCRATPPNPKRSDWRRRPGYSGGLICAAARTVCRLSSVRVLPCIRRPCSLVVCCQLFGARLGRVRLVGPPRRHQFGSVAGADESGGALNELARRRRRQWLLLVVVVGHQRQVTIDRRRLGRSDGGGAIQPISSVRNQLAAR